VNLRERLGDEVRLNALLVADGCWELGPVELVQAGSRHLAVADQRVLAACP
jgi:hypothetical protein